MKKALRGVANTAR